MLDVRAVRRPWRSLAVLAAIALCALGVAASLYSFHALVTRFYVTKENLVWVSTRAEVELARYSSSLRAALCPAVRTRARISSLLKSTAFLHELCLK